MHRITAPYLDDQRRRIAPLADVYLPEGPGPYKNAVICHGGGYFMGHRRMSAVLNPVQRMVELGWAVCTFDYRLIFKGGGYDEGIADTIAAVAWWRSQAGRFDLDLDHTVLMGVSAGAGLAQVATPIVGNIRKVANIYGPTDFTVLPGYRTGIPQVALTRSFRRRVWRRRSPMVQFDSDIPYLIQAGTRDPIVKPRHARHAQAHRAALGLPVQVEWYDAGHAWMRNKQHPEYERSMGNLLAFLER